MGIQNMTLKVPVELRNYVRKKVADGALESADQLVVEALRVYRELELRHDRLRSDIRHALEQVERGEGLVLTSAELRVFFEDSKKAGRQNLNARTDGP